jgi:hypothetical protein
MRRVEIVLFAAACGFASAAVAQTYDKADTFEPGKKYTCVPTADHKGWNCNEAGKAVEIKPNENEPPRPSATPQAESTPTPTSSSPPSAQPPARSTLPSYLTNAAASNRTPMEESPSTVSAAHANAPSPVAPPPSPAKSAAPAPTTKTVPLRPANSESSTTVTPAPPSRSSVKPAVPPRVTHRPVVEAAASSGGEFQSLPGDHFVIEMAHEASKRGLDAARSSTHVPNGDLYEVHLRQNGADAWLLLWGSFDTLEAARAARGALTSGTPGWPRRIAPLQAEARRVSP